MLLEGYIKLKNFKSKLKIYNFIMTTNYERQESQSWFEDLKGPEPSVLEKSTNITVDMSSESHKQIIICPNLKCPKFPRLCCDCSSNHEQEVTRIYFWFLVVAICLFIPHIILSLKAIQDDPLFTAPPIRWTCECHSQLQNMKVVND